jgi:sialic acid synthase SpsE
MNSLQRRLTQNQIVVLADLCTNHHQDKNQARRLLNQIAFCDGVYPKIQLYSQETWPDEFLDLLEDENEFVTSVFRPSDVAKILPYKPLALKIASTESLHSELINIALASGLPIIISTGGMTYTEIANLRIHTDFQDNIYYLHCIALYPTSPSKLYLAALSQFDGLSLHTSSRYLAETASLIAVAMHSNIFEYHIRLHDDTENSHSDAQSSLCIGDIVNILVRLNVAKSMLLKQNLDERPDRSDIIKYRTRWNQTYPSII